MAKRWYVVRVQSGRENTVQAALERKLRVAGKTDVIPRVLVPVESVTEVKAGQQAHAQEEALPRLRAGRGRAGREGQGPARGLGPRARHGRRGRLRRPAQQPRAAAAGRGRRCSRSWSAARTARRRSRSRSRRAMRSRSRKVRSSRSTASSTRSCPPRALVRVIVTIFGRATPVELEYWQVEAGLSRGNEPMAKKKSRPRSSCSARAARPPLRPRSGPRSASTA